MAYRSGVVVPVKERWGAVALLHIGTSHGVAFFGLMVLKKESLIFFSASRFYLFRIIRDMRKTSYI